MGRIVTGPIYHYTSFENAEKIQSSRELWFSHYGSTTRGVDSDAVQFKKRLSFFQIMAATRFSKRDSREIQLNLLEIANYNYYLASFCESENNAYLREEYSKFEACLEFSTEFFEDLRKKMQITSYPIIYADIESEKWSNNAKSMFENICEKYLKSNDSFDNKINFCAVIFAFCLQYKDKKFEREQEIRFAYFPDASEPFSGIRLDDNKAKLSLPLDCSIRCYNFASSLEDT